MQGSSCLCLPSVRTTSLYHHSLIPPPHHELWRWSSVPCECTLSAGLSKPCQGCVLVVCTHAPAFVWRSEGNLWESVSVGSRDGTHVARLWCQISHCPGWPVTYVDHASLGLRHLPASPSFVLEGTSKSTAACMRPCAIFKTEAQSAVQIGLDLRQSACFTLLSAGVTSVEPLSQADHL